MEAVAVAMATIVTIVGVGLMFFVPNLVLRPFVRPDDTCAPPRRFTTSDFFVLAFYLQLALVAGTWFATLGPSRHLQYAVSFLGSIAAVFVWFGAVESVSRTSIAGELRRGVFLTVLLPLTIVAMLSSGLAGPAIFWLIKEPEDALWGEGWIAPLLPFATPALILALRHLGRRLVSQPEPVEAPITVEGAP